MRLVCLAGLAAMIVAMASPVWSSPKPEPPCKSFYDYLRKVELEVEYMPSEDVYDSLWLKSYREGAKYIFNHQHADLDDWMYDQYRLCKEGRIDPLATDESVQN